MPKTPSGAKRPADVIGNAVHVMRIATGEVEDELVTPEAEGKDPNAAALGRKGAGGEDDKGAPSRDRPSGCGSPVEEQVVSQDLFESAYCVGARTGIGLSSASKPEMILTRARRAAETSSRPARSLARPHQWDSQPKLLSMA